MIEDRCPLLYKKLADEVGRH